MTCGILVYTPMFEHRMDAYKVCYIPKYTWSTLRCISRYALKPVCCQHTLRFLKRQSVKDILWKNNTTTWQHATYLKTSIGHTRMHRTHQSRLYPISGSTWMCIFLLSGHDRFLDVPGRPLISLPWPSFFPFFATRHKTAGRQIIQLMLKMACHSRLHKENKSQIWDLSCESTGS